MFIFSHRKNISAMKTITLWLMTALLSGCTIIGPSSISNGRLSYNEVINYTADQQLLNAIVRLRYGQTFSMLSVSSVTASVKFSTRINSQFKAWGSDESTDGSLTPLSLGVSYEENPTVSYSPLQGEKVVRRLASPISIDEGLWLLAAAKEQSIAERIIFKKLNHHVFPDNTPPSSEAQRLLNVIEVLRRKGISHFGRVKNNKTNQFNYLIVLADYSKSDYPVIREALDLLNIKEYKVDGGLIELSFGNNFMQKNASINVRTRSVLDWLRMTGNLIDVPQTHLQSGIVETSPWNGVEEDRVLTIHSSKNQPDNAVVSIQFRDWWFYIDATDSRSKNSFWLLKLLVGLRLNPDSFQHQTPLLTVPVN